MDNKDEKFKPFHLEGKHAKNDKWLQLRDSWPNAASMADEWEKEWPFNEKGERLHHNDMVNSPAHYTQGRYEVIDVIEDAIEEAPTAKAAMLQAQVLKYLLRMWHKIDAKEDAEKARWYLSRLINSL